MKKSLKQAKKLLKRQEDFDAIPTKDREGLHRPGSLKK